MMEQVVEQFKKWKIQGLLVVGGFEVSYHVLIYVMLHIVRKRFRSNY